METDEEVQFVSHEVLRSNLTKKKRAPPSKDRSLKCKVCGKKFSDHNDRRKHELIHLPGFPYHCSQCPYRGKTKHYLQQHIKKVHNVKDIKCDYCPAVFIYQSKKEEHMRVHTGEKPYKCDHCPKTFRVPYSLKSHMLTHTNEKPFQCSFCDYACRDNSTLRKHQNKHMGLVKLYNCTICSKSFQYKWKLKEHISELHLQINLKKHKCDQCGKLFKSPSLVAEHARKVHDRVYATKCPVCNVKMSNRYNLRLHLTSHVDYRPYICTEPGCNKSFKDRSTLKKHAILHRPELHFPCTLCNMRFSRKQRLRNHILKMHDERKKNVICDYCQVGFYTKNYLIKHILEKHTDRQTYECDECGMETTNKPGMILHLKYGHEDHENDRECKICHSIFKKHEYLKNHYYRTHNIRYKMVKQFGKKPQKPARDLKAEVKVKMEPVDENYDQINLLNVDKEELEEDCIEYSQRVLNEDITASILKSKGNVDEVEFDQFLVTHMFKKPKNEDNNIPEDVDPIELRKSKDIIEKLLKKSEKHRLNEEKKNKIKALAKKRIRIAKKEAKILAEKKKDEKENKRREKEYLDRREKEEIIELEKLRVKYNERMKNIPLNVHKKTETPKIKFFKTKNVNEEKNGPKNNLDDDDDISFAVKSNSNKNDNINDKTTKVTTNTLVSKDCDGNSIINEDIDDQNDLDDDDDDYISFAIKSTKNTNFNDEILNSSKSNQNPNDSDQIFKTKEGIDKKNDKIEEINDKLDEIYKNEEINLKGNEIVTDNEDDNEKRETCSDNEEKNDELSELNVKNNKLVPKNYNNDKNCEVLDKSGEIKDSNDELRKGNTHFDEDSRKNTETNDEQNPTSSSSMTGINNKLHDEMNRKKGENHIDSEKNDEFNKNNELNVTRRSTRSRKPNKLYNVDDGQEKHDRISKNDEHNMGRKRATKEIYGNDTNEPKNKKMIFKTHQCYVCFKLYPTKEELIEHCQIHFDICSIKTLTKCPICDFVTPKCLSAHLAKKHDINLKMPYNHIKENSDGSKYYYNAEGTIIEVVPSIKILNKNASIEIDKKNREKKDKIITKTKLVRKGKEWVVEKEKIDVKFDLLPQFDEKDYKKLKISDNYIDRMKQIYILAKKKGIKMAFPCFDCDKICQNLAALKLHNRKHQTNPKPFRSRGEMKKLKEKSKQDNKKLITNFKNRSAKPKPIEHNHKCDEKLKKFYETNIRGSDIEFWQFLKIYNKMDRENITEFEELEDRTDFGIHIKKNVQNPKSNNTKNDAIPKINVKNPKNDLNNPKIDLTATKNITKTKNNLKIKNTAVSAKTVKTVTKTNKIAKPGYKRVVMISKEEYKKRINAKNRLRQQNSTQNV